MKVVSANKDVSMAAVDIVSQDTPISCLNSRNGEDSLNCSKIIWKLVNLTRLTSIFG